MRKLIVAAMGTVVAVGAQAGTIKPENGDITLTGGAAGGLYMGTNVGSKDNATLQVSDFLVGLKTNTVGKGVGVSFEGNFGTVVTPTVGDTGVAAPSTIGFGIINGFMSVHAMKELRIDAGQLATTIGMESAPSLTNGNILRGMLWSAQPAYYSGIRATYSMGDMNFFGEFNEGTGAGGDNNDSWALGSNGEVAKIKYGATYMDSQKGRNYLDLLGSMELGDIELGANIDVVMLDSKATGQKDDTAFGFALYAKPKFGDISLPVRLEYVSGGDTNVYAKGALGLTVTPTLEVSNNAFVRAELSFVNSDDKIFADKDNAAQNTQIGIAAQAGYRF
jgi:hypothetical protein